MMGAKSAIVALCLFAASFASAAARANEGEDAYAICIACHKIGPGAVNVTGPHLNGLLNRKAGTAEGFHFSKAMKTAGEGGLVWTRETLGAFLEKPQDYVKGTRMPFRGVADAARREKIITYLEGFAETAAADPAVDPCADSVKAAMAVPEDKDYGQYLAGECVTCHQVSGHQDGIPAITGLPREVFVKALCEYRSKHRDHPVMSMITGNLGDAEFAALAAYFATLE